VNATRALLCFLPLAAAASGCFDVHAIDPGPVVLDDFDDGDFQPADPSFGVWMCYSFNPTNQSYSCDHDAGYNSAYSLVLHETVVDPMDGTQEHGGGALATYATTPVDFTRFTELDFATRLVSGSPPISSDARMYLEIGCATAATDDGSVPGDLYVLTNVNYDMSWKSLAAKLANFGPPPWITTPIKGGTAGCLQRADSVRFSVDAALPDGQTGVFTLNIDDIKFL
jgi:hypothetical protein